MSSSSEEDNWRDCVEIETNEYHFGVHSIQMAQYEELSVGASLFMLSEMTTQRQEISGTRIWTGSHLLAYILNTRKGFVQPRDCVLELGAGLGLCSILCGKLGAAQVFATDGDEDAVKLLRQNIHDNACDDVISSDTLYWGNDVDIARIQTRILDMDPSNTRSLTMDQLDAGKAMIFTYM